MASNPFTLKEIPAHAAFCDREKEQRDLVKFAKAASNTLLYSPRRYGKTKYGLERTVKVILDLSTVKFLSSYANKPIYLFGGAGIICAGINTVTKSGTNVYKASVYSYFRDQSLVGNEVNGAPVVANPDLTYYQSGFTLSGPILSNTLFFFLNAEVDRRKDPGTNFSANRGTSGFGISRVSAATMDPYGTG